MEQRISLITLGVTDLARSIAFYEALGFERSRKQNEGVAFFQMGGVVLGLYGLDALAEDAQVKQDKGGFAGVTLAYNTRSREEVDSVLNEARAVGAVITKEAQEVFWGGYSGYFADPDGYLWEVAWNPFFPMDADGTLRIAGT